MAFDAATEWEVRSTGDDTNGGGFKVGSGGTDFSQQDAAEHAYTDLVIDGTTNTKITSVARAFSSVDVGNVINITAGTGFTVQRVQIVSVASGAATCDKAVGTLGSTGGTGKLGGGLATPGVAFPLAVSLNTVWLKSGTAYSVTSTLNIGVARFQVRGYQTTHGDHTGTRPTITSATNSIHLLTRNSSSTTHILVDNLNLTHTAATRGNGVHNASTGTNRIEIVRSVIDGCNYGIGITQNITNLYLIDTEIKNSVAAAMAGALHATLIDCYLHDNALVASISAIELNLIRCILAGNASAIQLVNALYSLRIFNCTFANQTGNAIYSNAAPAGTRIVCQNSIFWGQGQYAFNFPAGAYSAADPQDIRNNAFGNNAAGDTQNFTTGASAVTLTADPFTNAAAGDYSLNNTAGGGAACKGVGVQLPAII